MRRIVAGVIVGLALTPAAAQAARVTIGSDLAAPATVARSDPNDIVFWHTSHPTAAVDVPVAGQAIIMRVKGGTVQPRGGSQDPLYDIMHFVVLRPQPDGTWRTTATTVEHKLPVIGRGATRTRSRPTPRSTRCACSPATGSGSRRSAGSTPSCSPRDCPTRCSPRCRGRTRAEFRAGGMINENQTVVRGAPLPDTELLMQVVVGTGSSARPTCGGTAPSGSDPGLLPEPSEPAPAPAARPRAFVVPPSGAARMRRGKVRLTVRCGAGAACAGALEVRARGRRLGRTSYQLPAGATRKVAVRLSGSGRRLVRRAGRIRARARVTAGGSRTSRTLTIRG